MACFSVYTNAPVLHASTQAMVSNPMQSSQLKANLSSVFFVMAPNGHAVTHSQHPTHFFVSMTTFPSSYFVIASYSQDSKHLGFAQFWHTVMWGLSFRMETCNRYWDLGVSVNASYKFLDAECRTEHSIIHCLHVTHLSLTNFFLAFADAP